MGCRRKKKLELVSVLKYSNCLWGKRKKFPYEIKKVEGLTFVKVELETEKDLIELIENEFRQPYNKKKKPSDVLDELGIRDTVILLDDFIEELFELYQFYKFDPSKLGKDFRWFEAYNIISRTEESQKPRMF